MTNKKICNARFGHFIKNFQSQLYLNIKESSAVVDSDEDTLMNFSHCVNFRNITFNEMDALIAEMAIKYKDDKKCELDQAITDLKEKLAGASSQLHGTTVSLAFLSNAALCFRIPFLAVFI